jgi:2-hydroxy-3-oxopropionate reductase
MGAPMIANLVGAGYEVRAFAHSERSRKRLRTAGAFEAATLAETVEAADVVVTMLPDSPDVLGVLFDDGLADALPRGSVFLDMSTIRPGASRRIATELAQRGVAALDAPVSGGEAGAIEGTLSIMVGGDAGALEAARPILSVMGSTITHVGPAGAGQATKAANQLVVAANIQAMAEAIVLLQAAGVDLEPALDALAGGLAGSTVLTRKRRSFTTGDFAPGFRLRLHDKDLGIVQASARELGLALPLTSLVSQLVAALVARGDGDLDHSALLALARDLNGRRSEVTA